MRDLLLLCNAQVEPLDALLVAPDPGLRGPERPRLEHPLPPAWFYHFLKTCMQVSSICERITPTCQPCVRKISTRHLVNGFHKTILKNTWKNTWKCNILKRTTTSGKRYMLKSVFNALTSSCSLLTFYLHELFQTQCNEKSTLRIELVLFQSFNPEMLMQDSAGHLSSMSAPSPTSFAGPFRISIWSTCSVCLVCTAILDRVSPDSKNM